MDVQKVEVPNFKGFLSEVADGQAPGQFSAPVIEVIEGGAVWVQFADTSFTEKDSPTIDGFGLQALMRNHTRIPHVDGVVLHGVTGNLLRKWYPTSQGLTLSYVIAALIRDSGQRFTVLQKIQIWWHTRGIPVDTAAEGGGVTIGGTRLE